MLKITKDIDYAALLVHHLANANIPQNVNSIAKMVPVSKAMIAKLLKILTSANILQSKLGKNGGYSLDAKHESISLYDIVFAIDGQRPAITVCSSNSTGCHITAACTIKHKWMAVNETLISSLKNTMIFSNKKLWQTNK